MTEPKPTYNEPIAYHKDSPEFARLMELRAKLSERVKPFEYQIDSFVDERGHVIAIVKVMGEYTGNTWEEATQAAIEGLTNERQTN